MYELGSFFILQVENFGAFQDFQGDCASGQGKPLSGGTLEQKCDITDSYSQMMLQLHDVYDSNKVNC